MNSFFDLGIILALIGLFYAYMQRTKHKKIVYDIVTRPLINFLNKELYVSANGQTFYQLSHTRIILRNEGEATVLLSDVLDGGITIEVVDDCDIIYSNIYPKGSCHIACEKKDSKCLQIKFDHIFYEDEIFVDIYHTGTSNNQVFVKCNATCQKEILRREYVSVPIPSLTPPNKKPFIKSFYITVISAFILHQLNIHTDISIFLSKQWGFCLNENSILTILSILVYIFSLSIFNYRYWRGLRNIKDL